MLYTAAGASAIAAFACTLASVGWSRVWQFYRTWLWLAAFIILFLSVLVFQRVYAFVSDHFPNGYPTEQFTPGGLRDKDGRVLRVPGT